MTTYDFNVSLSNPQDQKLNYEFGEEMNFHIKQKGRKNSRDQSFIKLLNDRLPWLLEFQQVLCHLILTS